MCLTCGCGLPGEKHGDVRHFTVSDLTAAADAAGVKPGKAVKNIRKTWRAAKKARKENRPGGTTFEVAAVGNVTPDASPKTPGR